MLPSPPQTLGGHVCTFTWTHAHAHFASRRHAASVCEDGGSGDAARPADALTARAFAHDRYRYCTDRVQKTGGKYREALLHTSLVKKARGPGRGWRFGNPVPPVEGPMAQKTLHTISTYLVLIVCRSSGVALPQKSLQRLTSASLLSSAWMFSSKCWTAPPDLCRTQTTWSSKCRASKPLHCHHAASEQTRAGEP